jgi:Spy/CpxP family protein refolding chaperone
MKHMRPYVLALALLLGALPAAAQPGGPPGEGPEQPGAGMLDEERRPFELLFRARRELALTDAQVARLRGIAEQLEERNRPLRERLAPELARYRQQQIAEIERELLRTAPEERPRRLRELREEALRRGLPPHMRPLAAEMRRNLLFAQHEAQQVLTPRQKHRARQLLEAHRGRIRGGRPGPGGRRPGLPRRGRP